MLQAITARTVPSESKACLEYQSKAKKVYQGPRVSKVPQAVTDKLDYQVSTVLQEDKALKANVAPKDKPVSGKFCWNSHSIMVFISFILLLVS